MACIHQALQLVRTAVCMMGRIEIHAVVSPAAISRELVNGHHLYMRDAQIYKMIEIRLIALSNVPSGVNVPMCSS